jgi:hypothetical protein
MIAATLVWVACMGLVTWIAYWRGRRDQRSIDEAERQGEFDRGYMEGLANADLPHPVVADDGTTLGHINPRDYR